MPLAHPKSLATVPAGRTILEVFECASRSKRERSADDAAGCARKSKTDINLKDCFDAVANLTTALPLVDCSPWHSKLIRRLS
jgi:hypothetical protein